jgi:hypothetical protein
MSLVQDLADRLRAAHDQLPVAEITAAAERMRAATALMAWVLHHSSRPDAVPSLGNAAERLDHAAAALRAAQDSLDSYSLAIGIAVDSYPDNRLPAVPGQVQRAHSVDHQLADWWSTRVCHLTGHPMIEKRGEGAESSTELLALCVDTALEADTAALHRHLVSAGPAVGLGLAAVAPPLLRHLALDLVGHAPRLEDLARVRRAALPLLAKVLPELTPDPGEEIIARVCHAQPQRKGSQPNHPTDVAVASALLVAALLKATGRSGDELSKVVEQEQRSNGAHRMALRITDNAKRRSAVDELRPATP